MQYFLGSKKNSVLRFIDYLSLNHDVLQKKKKGHRLKSFADFKLFARKLWCSLKKKGLRLKSASNLSNFIPNQYHFSLNLYFQIKKSILHRAKVRYAIPTNLVMQCMTCMPSPHATA